MNGSVAGSGFESFLKVRLTSRQSVQANLSKALPKGDALSHGNSGLFQLPKKWKKHVLNCDQPSHLHINIVSLQTNHDSCG